MDIFASNYYRDIEEKRLKTFLISGKIGIHNLDSGKKTLPSFNHVITSSKYIYVEVGGCWGMLGWDLCLIVPPIYTEIFPVIKIDRDIFISGCLTNQSAVGVTLSSNSCIPTHIGIQTKEINSDKEGLSLSPSFYRKNIEDEDKACIYEIINSLEKAETDLFVAFSDDDTQLIDAKEIEIKQNTGFRGYEFFPLWHYKDNMFIIRNHNGTYVTSTYKDGRFAKKSLWGEYDDSFEEHGSPKVVLHRGEFVSVCYPENFRFIGSPFSNQDKEKDFDKKRGKWALFKYHHTKIEEDDKGWHKYFSNEKTCFEQLIPFVFEEYATQLQNDNEFICHGDGMDIFMRFEQNGVETSESVKVDERYETKPCSQGHLNLVACYDSIEQREDGLFDIITKDGCGLCDKDMGVLIPAKYDFPIGEWGVQLTIVCQHGKYGVINKKAEEIIPCKYDYIQIGKDEFNIWDYECEWDELLNESVPNFSICNKNEISSSDEDLVKEGYLIVGIINGRPILPDETSVPNTLFGKLARIATKKSTSEIEMIHCDIYSSEGKLLSNCGVSKSGKIEFDRDLGILMVFDYCKQYGIYVNKSSASVLTSNELSDDIHSLSGNSSEGFCDLEEIIITKDVDNVEWNGLGRCRFRKFRVDPENRVFCEEDGVLYTQKGYNRKGETNKKHMIELVACPTNVLSHDVKPGTKRIANCAFKGTKIETLNLPDTLEEIGVNAFYLTPNLKYLKIPMSIRKIEAQDVGRSGNSSPQIVTMFAVGNTNRPIGDSP